jgi:hypothetical protein
MGQQGLRDAIAEFVAVIDNDPGASEYNEQKLLVLLDRVALAVSEHPLPFEWQDYEGGDGMDSNARRARVCVLFPDFGYYNVPEFVTKNIANTAVTVGDAIDDIVDITAELSAVLKVWKSEGERQAMRALAGAYKAHLGDHLRDLQRYLHARFRESNCE